MLHWCRLCSGLASYLYAFSVRFVRGVLCYAICCVCVRVCRWGLVLLSIFWLVWDWSYLLTLRDYPWGCAQFPFPYLLFLVRTSLWMPNFVFCVIIWWIQWGCISFRCLVAHYLGLGILWALHVYYHGCCSIIYLYVVDVVFRSLCFPFQCLIYSYCMCRGGFVLVVSNGASFGSLGGSVCFVVCFASIRFVIVLCVTTSAHEAWECIFWVFICRRFGHSWYWWPISLHP